MDNLEKERIIRIARMHYVDGLNYQQISEKLNISPSYISKLLRAGREQGIIEIRIRDDAELDRVRALKEKLIEGFHLKDAALLVTPETGNVDMLKQRIGRAASAYLYENLVDHARLGISWGPTIHETVNALLELRRKDLHIICVQLCGNLPTLPLEENGINLVARISEVFRGTYYLLPAPALVDTPYIRDALMTDSSIKQTFEQFPRIDCAISGVGAMDDLDRSTLFRIGCLESSFMEELRERGAVGDILFQFFTLQGDVMRTGLEERIVGMGLEAYRRISNKIIIAGGAYKVKPLYGALNAGMVDTLVTDTDTAGELLRMKG
jgi:deoxyribonucleoside regulator